MLQMSSKNGDDLLKISDLVKDLTHTGVKRINEIKLNSLKILCKNSDKFIDRAHSCLLYCLKKNHSEIRLNAFKICCELFKAYPYYRKIFVKDLKRIIDLTTGVNGLTLPLPKNSANDLRRLTLYTLKEWSRLFGGEFRQLKSFYTFLNSKIQIDPATLEVQDSVTRQRREAEKRRLEIVNNERLLSMQNEMKDVEAEIENAVTSLDSCIHMLVPTVDDFFIVEPSKFSSKSKQKTVEHPQQIGSETGSTSFETDNVALKASQSLSENCSEDISLSLEIDNNVIIKETEENFAIIESAKEQYRLINKYFPKVKNWLNIAIKASDNQDILKKIIDLKNRMSMLIAKYEKLRIQKVDVLDSDSDESDMEEVPITSADDLITTNLLQFEVDTSENKRLQQQQENNTLTSSDRQAVDNDESKKRKQALLEIAPKLPFDMDLYYWEDEDAPVSKLLPPNVEGHRFWSSNALSDTDGIPLPDDIGNVRTRIIEFTGKFEPSKWECRTPLANGKLCPRKDKIKCPFHGLIVGRNKNGDCTNPEDAKREKELLERKQRNTPDWQDPMLLAEIKHTTGVDLKMPEPGKRTRKNRKSENDLTDLKTITNTPYARLSKKIFKKSTIKQVARTLDGIDRRKFRDKFGDQFHYVHDTA